MHGKNHKMNNILYVSENTQSGSHVFDLSSGIEQNSDFYALIDYTEMYKTKGKIGFESHIKKLILNNIVDTIIIGIGAGMIIDIFFIKELSENYSVKIIISFPDSEHLFEGIDRYYAQTADLVWVFNPSLEKIFNIYNIHTFSNQGFDTYRYSKKVMKKTIDVSFIGGINRGNREEYIDFLRKNGIEVELAGFGTKKGLITTKEKNQIVYQSKINLNFTGVLSNDKNIFKRIKQPKGRPQELALLGGFVLSENASGLGDIFEIEEEIAVFHSKEELLAKIKFYLQNDEIRESMAVAGYKKALNSYETVSVVKELLCKLESVRNSNKTYYVDSQFASLFTSARFYYLTISLISGNFKSAVEEIRTIKKFKNIHLNNFYYDIPRAIYHYFRDTNSKRKVGFD
jgi:hypothetical protein